MCHPTNPTSSASSTASKSHRSDVGGGGTRSMSSSRKERKLSKPAFEGAAFDRNGYCVKHDSVQLAEQVKQDGRLLWQELKMNCPKCVSEHHKSRRVTSLGGAGKVKRGRTVHGKPNPLRSPSKQGRHMDKEFDTPFDDKGRCHHHPTVQMATKKARGGWKILCQACPKCIEANYEEESVDSRASSSRGSRSGRGDASVSSRSTKRSVASRTKPVKSSVQFDRNGCCTRHPTVQIAKKKLLGGWKEFRTCPKCLDPNYDDMADNASVGSRGSRSSFRSTGTAKSGRSARRRKSVKSNSSRKGGRKTDRYGALPFDEEGYCHAHPGVRLAKKKALGGWKVLHDICPDCAHDASSNAGSRTSRSSRGTGRVYDDSGSDASSYKSGKSGKSSSSRKKKIRVKDMRYRDEHGKEGRYSGDVDEDHSPHGQGKMKYKDGSAFEGVWSEGSQVHGKATKAKSSKSSSGSSKGHKGSSGGHGGKGGSGSNGGKGSKSDWARIKDSNDCGNSAALTVPAGNTSGKGRTVRKMKWMDYYGDPGEYTGEVDGSNMPNGKGSMKYDHGLVQEGTWAKGQFVEGSDANAAASEGKRGGGRSSSGHKKSSGRSSGDRSGRKHSSSRTSSSRGLEP